MKGVLVFVGKSLVWLVGFLLLIWFLQWIGRVGYSELSYMPRAVEGRWKNLFDDRVRYVQVKENLVDVITEDGEAMRCIIDRISVNYAWFGTRKTTEIRCRSDTGSAVTFSRDICDGGKIWDWLVVVEQDTSEDEWVRIEQRIQGACGEDGSYRLPNFESYFDRVD